MRKYLLLTTIAFILIAYSCKKEEHTLPDKPNFTYSLINISNLGVYQMKLSIANYNADLNYLYLWDLGTGKYIPPSSSTFYNKV